MHLRRMFFFELINWLFGDVQSFSEFFIVKENNDPLVKDANLSGVGPLKAIVLQQLNTAELLPLQI